MALALGQEQEGQRAAGLVAVGDPAVPVPAGDLVALDLVAVPDRLEEKTVVGPVAIHLEEEEVQNRLGEVQMAVGPALRWESSPRLHHPRVTVQEHFPDGERRWQR